MLVRVTGDHVVPLYGDVLVTVWPCVLVVQAQGMHQLMAQVPHVTGTTEVQRLGPALKTYIRRTARVKGRKVREGGERVDMTGREKNKGK